MADANASERAMSDDHRDGLVRRLTPRSARARTVATVGVPAAGLTAAIYASEPVAHVASTLVHTLGTVSAESVGVGAGAAIAATGIMKAADAMADEEYARTWGYGIAGFAGLATTAVSIGALAHDVPDALIIGGIGGAVVAIFGAGIGGIIVDETDSDITTGMRRVAVGAGAIGIAGVASDVLNSAGLHGVPDPSLMGHIGIGAVAASAVPAAFVALKHRRDARTQRAQQRMALGE